MSENNYIFFLKDSTILIEQNKIPYVLTCNNYTEFKNYSLVNTIPNIKNCFSRLSLDKKTNIFNIEVNTNNCSKIEMCNNTNNRTNRYLKSPQLPEPTYRLNKIYVPNCCNFNNGYIKRRCICSKKVCKYKTDICGSTKKYGISGSSSDNNLGS
jgi:hypothetical protein